jgi:gluconokinase
MDASALPPILALDLGSSSAKAILWSAARGIVARAEEPIATLEPEPGISEQDPDRALEAARRAVTAVAAACGGQPACLVLSCAMHAVIPLDRDGSPLGRLRTWADSRGATVAKNLVRSTAALDLWRRTGTPLHASSPLCKLAHMRESEPTLFDAAHSFVSLAEYLLLRTMASRAVSCSLASATGMFDAVNARWDDEALSIAGVDGSRLGMVVDGRTRVHSWRDGMAYRFGLDPATPIVLGASDGCLANLGLDAIAPGVAAASFGTSAALRIATRSRRADPARGSFSYVLDEGVWITGAAVNDMGNAARWAADLLFAEVEPNRRVDALLDAALGVASDARGVRFTPGLAGRRFPDYDSAPAGAIGGLSLAHGRAEIARAIVDGLCDQVAAIATALRAGGSSITRLRIGGGLVRSRGFRRMLAERLPSGLEIVDVEAIGVDAVDASAVGAARYAHAALTESPLEGAESLE